MNMQSTATNIDYLLSYRANLGGGDCANFVSQALVSGKIEMNDDWHYNKYTNHLSAWNLVKLLFPPSPLKYENRDGLVTTSRIGYDFTGSWASAHGQYEYFSNPTNGYSLGEVIKITSGSKFDIYNAINSGIQIGDLLYWDFQKDGRIDHATMITKIDEMEIYFGGHTRPRKEHPIYDLLAKDHPDGVVYIVKMLDESGEECGK